MKKSLVITLVLAMLLSLGWGGFKAVDTAADPGDTVVRFSDILNIEQSGADVKTGDYAHYFEYRTCIVHTSHGDYAVYFTDTIKKVDNREMNQFSVIKINADGTTEVVFQEWKAYDSSQVSLHVDADENVWALVAGDNGRLKEQFDGRPTAYAVAAYRIDAATDEVKGYTATLPKQTAGGFGYAVSVMDVVQNKIYAVAVDGSSNDCSLYWAIFDMETLTWDGNIRSIPLEARHAYHYIYADGKGGMIVLDERDSLVTSSVTPYPEIGNNNGLTDEELNSFNRWSANYVWDQLDVFYITDVNTADYERVTVAPADYSRVLGDQAYRNSLEGRKNNLYPNITNNQGDTFIDADGYLHVLYVKSFDRAAYDRSNAEVNWYHVVYDISDPANMVKLSETKLGEEVADGYEYAFRMYQDSKGDLYLICGKVVRKTTEGLAVVYKLEGTAQDGYELKELGSRAYTGLKTLCIANNRSNSTIDDVISVIYRNENESYNYFTITLDVEPTPAEFAPEDVKIDLRDQNGKQLAIGDGEFTVKGMLDEDHVITGKVAADGTVTFDAFELTEEGQYIIQVSMDKGTDGNVKYSEEVYYFGVVVERDGDELVAHRSGIVLNQESVDEAVFHVVKTIKNPDSGDHTQVWLWVALAGAAVCAGAIALVLRKKSYSK